jgi:hypothetical protein
MKLTEKQIEEIAENLECGMRCFYNQKTGEIKTLLNMENWSSADEELWDEEAKEINDSMDDYFEFNGLESRDSFRIMADFAESIDDTDLQNKLIYALNRPKPFQNFKWRIDNSGDYRQQWFDFKRKRFIEWVKEQIEFINMDFDEQFLESED